MSPVELHLGCRPKSRLDLLKPMTAERVETNQLRQKKQHFTSAIDCSFKEWDSVFAKNYQPVVKWVIIWGYNQENGPVLFLVRSEDGQQRHGTIKIKLEGEP